MPLPPFIVPSIHYRNKSKSYHGSYSTYTHNNKTNKPYTSHKYKKSGGIKKSKYKTKSKPKSKSKTKTKNEIEKLGKKVKVKTYSSYL